MVSNLINTLWKIRNVRCSTSVLARTNDHGGNSKGTTCVVDRDVTAYLVVDRVLRLPTEQYGCRYGGHPGLMMSK